MTQYLQYLQQIRSEHVVTVVYALILVLFIVTNRTFVRGALSEGNSPSSLRLTGFVVFLTCCTAFVYDTAKNGLDMEKFKSMLLAGAALYGLIKAAQMRAGKGIKDAADPAAPAETKEEVQ